MNWNKLQPILVLVAILAIGIAVTYTMANFVMNQADPDSVGMRPLLEVLAYWVPAASVWYLLYSLGDRLMSRMRREPRISLSQEMTFVPALMAFIPLVWVAAPYLLSDGMLIEGLMVLSAGGLILSILTHRQKVLKAYSGK